MKLNSFKMMAGAIMMVLTAATTLASCDDDQETTRYEANIVTIKPQENNSWLLQLNDSTRLLPSNISASPYGTKELRAYVVYVNQGRANSSTQTRDYQVNVVSIDTILTKALSENLIAPNNHQGSMAEDSSNYRAYGADPVGITDSWETTATDGYLTLRFCAKFGGATPHAFHLVHRDDLDEDYVLELYHDAQGDTDGPMADGIVAFRLSDHFNLPNDSIRLTLKYKSFNGEKYATFDYKPRKQ